MGKPVASGGLGWGAGPVSVVIALIIAVLVAYLAISGVDIQAQNVASDAG